MRGSHFKPNHEGFRSARGRDDQICALCGVLEDLSNSQQPSLASLIDFWVAFGSGNGDYLWKVTEVEPMPVKPSSTLRAYYPSTATWVRNLQKLLITLACHWIAHFPRFCSIIPLFGLWATRRLATQASSLALILDRGPRICGLRSCACWSPSHPAANSQSNLCPWSES